MIVMCNKQINNTQETSAVEFMERFKAIQRKDVASKQALLDYLYVSNLSVYGSLMSINR